MSKTDSIAQALTGANLEKVDRDNLPASLLALFAVGGHIKLTHADRRRMAKTTLALLAVAGVVELTRQERDRLCPHELALVAMQGRTELRDSELARLPGALRELVDDASHNHVDDRFGAGSFGRFPRLAEAEASGAGHAAPKTKRCGYRYC